MRGWKFNHTRARGQILMISSCSLAFPAFYFIFPGAVLYYIRRVWNLLDCVLRPGGWARRAKKSYWYFSWSLSLSCSLSAQYMLLFRRRPFQQSSRPQVSLSLPATLCIKCICMCVCALGKGPEKNASNVEREEWVWCCTNTLREVSMATGAARVLVGARFKSRWIDSWLAKVHFRSALSLALLAAISVPKNISRSTGERFLVDYVRWPQGGKGRIGDYELLDWIK